MKNNGKVRDVCSLIIHWNISEIVYSLAMVFGALFFQKTAVRLEGCHYKPDKYIG